MARAIALVCSLCVLLAARLAFAHAVGLSNGEYRVEGSDVVARIVVSRAETSGVDPTALLDGVAVRAGAGACTRASVGASAADNDGVAVTARWTCPGAADSASVDLGAFFAALPSGHRHVARVSGTSTDDRVLHRGSASFEIPLAAAPAPPPSPSAWGFVRMGVEHILTGYDHLLFLFGLVLVRGRVRSVLATVTAFTVAHSVTLALASFGAWTPSPRIVEPLIALSIAYVGVENFFVKDAARRWRVTFPFGLVHGFGFAGALREIDLPRAKIPMALLSFNAGVELGQLAVLALVLPALLLLRRSARLEAKSVRLASYGIVAAGLVWFVQRIVSA